MKQEQSNFSQHRQSDNINTYTYCWKCLKKLTTPSLTPFCDSLCRREFYQEQRQDNDDLYREVFGID